MTGADPTADDLAVNGEGADGVDIAAGQDEVVRLCRDLLRIDTSNPGGSERPAAEYVAAALAEVGVECDWFEPEPGRTSIVCRLAGRDRSLPPLLVHAHLDVVPAVAEDWTTDPFGGVIADGQLWGRGAVDMKGMVAAMVALVRSFARDRAKPRRDVVLAFFADEEAGGELGARYVTSQRPDLFVDCEDAIGEVGGFSFQISPDERCYLVSNAEKGVLWASLVADGRAGHGSMINDDNAVTALAEAVSRLARHEFASEPTETVQALLAGLADRLGVTGETADSILDKLGPLARMIRASMRDTVNPTTLAAGYKVNVVPAQARATVDGRFLPGHQADFERVLADLAGDRVRLEPTYSGPAVESPWEVPIVAAIESALRREDPGASILPYMGTAFTDAKWLSRLGIRCYGFCPLLLPPDLDYTSLFHGVDERVPLDALRFCVAVMRHLLDEY